MGTLHQMDDFEHRRTSPAHEVVLHISPTHLVDTVVINQIAESGTGSAAADMVTAAGLQRAFLRIAAERAANPGVEPTPIRPIV